jgi:hypothetical protein
MDLSQYLYSVAHDADPSIVGGGAIDPGDPVAPDWFVVTRADGIRFHIDTADGSAPSQAAVNAVMNADVTPATIAAYAAAKDRTATITAFMNDFSPTARITRALALVVKDVYNTFVGDVVGSTTATWDPASVANGASLLSPNVTVIGAQVGDAVDVKPPPTLNVSGMFYQGFVTAANTVQVRIGNLSGAAINLASGDWTVIVYRPVKRAAAADSDLLNAVVSHIQTSAT